MFMTAERTYEDVDDAIYNMGIGMGKNSDSLQTIFRDQEVDWNCEEGGSNRKRNHEGDVKEDYRFSIRECPFPDTVEDAIDSMSNARRGGQSTKYLAAFAKAKEKEVDSNDVSTWIPPRNTVDWRGNAVTEKEGMALKHLFDDMKDYFGQHDGRPKVTLSVGRLQEDDGETNDTTKKDNWAAEDSTIWRGNLEFTYTMNYRNRDTSQKLHYMAMDVCLDIKPKKELKFGGHDMSEYCKTWMYAYAPKYTVETFLRYFEEGTGFKASSNGLVLDEEQKIVHFEPKLLTDEQSEPGFWIADEDDNKQFHRVGSVHEASKDPSNHFLFRCVGIFAVTAEVARDSSGTHDASASEEKEEARLTFTLINVRTEGIVKSIAPVVYNPRHCTKFNSSKDPEWWRQRDN